MDDKKQMVDEQPVETEVQGAGPQEQKVDPQFEKESQAYISGLMKMLHTKETSPQIVEMLKAGDPTQTIPQIAMMVNEQMEGAARQAGKAPSLEVLLSAGMYLANDLIEIGNAAGAFDIQSEEEIVPIVQATLQTYIEKGLKEGTIDPVELQEAVEPLMSDDQRSAGLEAASMTGVPEAPDQNVAMEKYAVERSGMMKGGK